MKPITTSQGRRGCPSKLGVVSRWLLPFFLAVVLICSGYGYDPPGLNPNPVPLKITSAVTSLHSGLTKLSGYYIYSGAIITTTFYNNSEVNWDVGRVWFSLDTQTCAVVITATQLKVIVDDGTAISTTAYTFSQSTLNTITKVFGKATSNHFGLQYDLTGTWSGDTDSAYLLALSQTTLSISSTLYQVDKSDVGNWVMDVYIPATTVINVQFWNPIDFVRGIIEQVNGTLPANLTVFYVK